MSYDLHSPTFQTHLETLAAKAFQDDARCHGWRLNLTSPQRFMTAGNVRPGALQPGAKPYYQARHELRFLGKVAGEWLFLLDEEPGDELERRLINVSAQVSALLACNDLDAALELDAQVEAQAKAHPDFNWYGVYRLVGEDLWLTSFRGAATPHIKIATSSGICGAAVRENTTLNIADVYSDPRYLSCSIETRSELVVPIRDVNGRAIAEIDIDAHVPSAFDARLVNLVEGFAGRLTPLMLKLR